MHRAFVSLNELFYKMAHLLSSDNVWLCNYVGIADSTKLSTRRLEHMCFLLKVQLSDNSLPILRGDSLLLVAAQEMWVAQ